MCRAPWDPLKGSPGHGCRGQTDPFSFFQDALIQLAEQLTGPFNFELAADSIAVKISEAIMYLQERNIQTSAKVRMDADRNSKFCFPHWLSLFQNRISACNIGGSLKCRLYYRQKYSFGKKIERVCELPNPLICFFSSSCPNKTLLLG